MYVTFDTLPEESRIWIYQAQRELSSEEQLQILELGQSILHQSMVQPWSTPDWFHNRVGKLFCSNWG